jgi:hypothetical protein
MVRKHEGEADINLEKIVIGSGRQKYMQLKRLFIIYELYTIGICSNLSGMPERRARETNSGTPQCKL